jgi:ABC-type uncharacterized transport system substrate-binding protein
VNIKKAANIDLIPISNIYNFKLNGSAMKFIFEKILKIETKTFFNSFQNTIFSEASNSWISVFIILIFLGINATVWGHAHVWINGAVIIYFDKEGISGFKQEWVLDEMFSQMVIHDYDSNQNGKFEPDEVEKVYEGAFINLKNFNYFTHVKIDGKAFKVEFVKDFNAKIVKDSVVYHFFVPCHVKALSSFKEIRIAVYDESFYTNVTVLKDQVFLKNDTDYQCSHKIVKNKEDAYYYGQMYPEEIVLRFRRKNE